jgi:hypothetical protein
MENNVRIELTVHQKTFLLTISMSRTFARRSPLHLARSERCRQPAKIRPSPGREALGRREKS